MARIARRTQAERSHATRTALLAAARELFAANGFAATGREQIAERAGVTRGALYHHFTNKEELFRAVVEELESELTSRVAVAAMKGANAAERLRLGAMAFLDACLDPAVRRVVLLDAPAVLGWDSWREIDARYGLALIAMTVQEAVDEGLLPAMPVEPLANVLLGAINEAALLVATSRHPRRTRKEVGDTVTFVIDRLLEPGA